MLVKPVNLLVCALAFGVMAGCSDGPETVASVNDKEISKGEFEAYLKFKRIPAQDEERRERALDALLEREALALEIEKTGIMDQELVQAELEEFRRQMLISRYFENYLDDAVTDQGVANFYAGHSDRYETESVKVSHILIRVSPEMSEPERQAKLSTAHEAYSKLQQGQEFSDVAEQYSEDKLSAAKGGNLGWLQKGAVGPTFSKVVFELDQGDISEPFLTPFGFHIAKVTDGPQTLKKTLDAVRGDIRYELRNEAKAAERQRLLDAASIEKEEG